MVMTENKRYYRDFSGDNGTIIRDRTIDGELGEVFEFGLSDSKDLCELLNEKEETIQDLLKYKYLVKALEEINKTYIEELISDWTDGAYSDKEEQLQLGKYHSENGLSWEDGDVE